MNAGIVEEVREGGVGREEGVVLEGGRAGEREGGREGGRVIS